MTIIEKHKWVVYWWFVCFPNRCFPMSCHQILVI